MEAQDTHLKLLGAGWVYGNLDVLGASLRWDHESKATWHTDVDYILSQVEQADELIAYNGQYDFGILKMWGADIDDKLLTDVLLWAKLEDNRHLKYDLDYVSKRLLGKSKGSDELGEWVKSKGMYSVNRKGTEVFVNADLKKCVRWSKENMRKVYDSNPELIAKYCNMDVDLTWELYYLLKDRIVTNNIDLERWNYRFSCITKLLLASRENGIKVDIDKAKEASKTLVNEEKNLISKMLEMANESEINFNSPKDLRIVCDKLKIPYKVKKKTANPEFDKVWLGEQAPTYPLVATLKEYRRILKLRRDFLDKLIRLQDLMPEDKRGYIYPEFKLCGAETGRMSAALIQQIPSRNPFLSKLIKSCFIADTGLWCVIDYCQQEFRLFVELCHKFGVDSRLFFHYQKHPDSDAHTTVANMVGIDRPSAKGINLGGLYHMGLKKMIRELMALGISEDNARTANETYHKNLPAVKKFQKYCSDTIRAKGYIETILGRKLYLDKPMPHPETGELMTFEYQGISKLIQGSAADMMMEALTKCWESGIVILFSVHDSIVHQVHTLQEAYTLNNIMTNAVPELRTPMTTKIEIGTSWGTTKEIC